MCRMRCCCCLGKLIYAIFIPLEAIWLLQTHRWRKCLSVYPSNDVSGPTSTLNAKLERLWTLSATCTCVLLFRLPMQLLRRTRVTFASLIRFDLGRKLTHGKE